MATTTSSPTLTDNITAAYNRRHQQVAPCPEHPVLERRPRRTRYEIFGDRLRPAALPYLLATCRKRESEGNIIFAASRSVLGADQRNRHSADFESVVR